MLITALLALLLALAQTPAASPASGSSVFADLGSEHCAQEVAVAAFTATDDADLAAADSPTRVTYTAFAFDSADAASAALDAAEPQVARFISGDPEVTERDDYGDLVVEQPTEERGDRTVSYTMTFPSDDAANEVRYATMYGVQRDAQVVIVLLFGEGGGDDASPGLSAEAALPFLDALSDDWDGSGDLAAAIPDNTGLPIGWESTEAEPQDSASC